MTLKWKSMEHDDEPRDQLADLHLPSADHEASWGEVGPDGRRTPGGWSWTIMGYKRDGQGDPLESITIADGDADSEEEAKAAVEQWYQAELAKTRSAAIDNARIIPGSNAVVSAMRQNLNALRVVAANLRAVNRPEEAERYDVECRDLAETVVLVPVGCYFCTNTSNYPVQIGDRDNTYPHAKGICTECDTRITNEILADKETQ